MEIDLYQFINAFNYHIYPTLDDYEEADGAYTPALDAFT